jgi:hypothetical protein
LKTFAILSNCKGLQYFSKRGAFYEKPASTFSRAAQGVSRQAEMVY